jgi:hypothetical protein
MASLEKQKGNWRIVFRYGGQKFQRALTTTSEKEAKAMKARVEENLELLTRGRLSYSPESDDLVTILLSDGRLNSLPRYTERIHIKHLLRIFGRRTLVKDVPEKLQRYIAARTTDGVGQVTIRKELSTLSSIWNRWGVREKLVPGPLSLRNLEYPKTAVKPPFQTWAKSNGGSPAARSTPKRRANCGTRST